MVEITIPIVLQFLQTVGILVGIIYYIMTIRTNQRNQELTLNAQELALETRKIQFILELNRQRIETPAVDYQEVMSIEWDDFEDFFEKYGVSNNPENYNKRSAIWHAHNTSGLMIRDGILDVKTYIEYMGDAPVQVWIKYKDIIEEFRRQFGLPTYMIGFEILAGEIEKYRMKEGW